MEATLDKETRLENVNKNKAESGFRFGIGNLRSSEAVKKFLDETINTESDPEKQRQLLAQEIMHWRDHDGYAISEIDNEHTPFTPESEQAYADWDQNQATKILKKYSALKEMEAIMPKPAEESSEQTKEEAPIVEVDPLAETQKIDLEEVAKEEMAEIMPATPEKVFTRTDVERYDDLIIKAENKAREYKQKATLNDAEKKRLAEIESDIVYFYDRKDKALEKEKPPLKTVPELKTEDRQPAVVREELIKLTKKPEQPPAPATINPTPQEIKSEERSFLSRWFGGSNKKSEPEPLTTETPQTPKEKILANPPRPLKKVDGINSGIEI